MKEEVLYSLKGTVLEYNGEFLIASVLHKNEKRKLVFSNTEPFKSVGILGQGMSFEYRIYDNRASEVVPMEADENKPKHSTLDIKLLAELGIEFFE